MAQSTPRTGSNPPVVDAAVELGVIAMKRNRIYAAVWKTHPGSV
jgi:hypothetical protein